MNSECMEHALFHSPFMISTCSGSAWEGQPAICSKIRKNISAFGKIWKFCKIQGNNIRAGPLV